jgi:hypothetical protein
MLISQHCYRYRKGGGGDVLAEMENLVVVLHTNEVLKKHLGICTHLIYWYQIKLHGIYTWQLELL